MRIEIIKHFDPEDTTFYGDFYVTVELGNDDNVKTPFDLLATYRESNTTEAEAFAAGYAQALQTVGYVRGPVEIVHLKRADAEEDVG